MPITMPLENYIDPLLSLSPEKRLFIADCLYTHSEEDAYALPYDAYDTMPGQFTEQERVQRMVESYNTKSGKGLDDVVNLMLAV